MKRNRLLIIGQLAILIFLGSCNSDDEVLEMPVEEGTDQTYREVLDFTKDKARYNPGEEVTFSVNGTHQNTMVRYKYLGEVVAEENLSSHTWTWTPPSEDFRGYMVELVKTTGGEETVLGTVGVDVSSDWTRFPRYGFLSEFGNISAGERVDVLNNLKDYHINGLQYYDWHSKHHIPLPTDDSGNPADSWADLFNREIYFETVEGYVESAKERNMASMFYNLLFGAWHPEEGDGFEEEWLIFNDRTHNSVNKHGLGDLGDILITDPSNEEWQNYIFDEAEVVYSNLDFAGWHLDQLGNRGTVYDYNGYQVALPEAYQDFLIELNEEFPDKKMVLNAVDQFGQKKILNSPVDFAYTEVWSRYQYQDLVQVIKENYEYSDGELNTVLAAYMNYNSQEGNFNTPSVLMADAVIFAFGGAHLELGEHMLSSEYFPNTKLSMTSELSEKLKEYYDFQVAYQNLLRDGGTFNMPAVSTIGEDVTVNNWPPVFSQTAAVGKQLSDKQVVHLLNFDGLSTLQWRDDSKIQTAPKVKEGFELVIETAQVPSKVWFASPDVDGGASHELEFTSTGNKVTVQVPYLEYWSMIVLEN
ncbi:glycoside hydrolase family 66 protein [Christiangramia crocea]|uniref:Glycoside hydrolase family 66 protein n=1 Tax=Christiangramia crocea TaxID=2904124 RepID=A0A9X1UUN8_9FLAO|nr:glycoside hydrolase family 66 protein [Gramella crocea]MCG9970599.1 glycoside hydrolase family 66 protein [Gramella crocea]